MENMIKMKAKQTTYRAYCTYKIRKMKRNTVNHERKKKKRTKKTEVNDFYACDDVSWE